MTSTAPRADLLLHLARSRLLWFTQATYPSYQVEAMHRLIGETLDRVVAGELARLMIFAPPQHGKSELVSVRLPAFWLGRRPDDPVILCSYAASLAHAKSKEARSIVTDELWQQLFPGLSLDPGSRSGARWRLAEHRGATVAAGVGGPITGHGCRLGIIDDPFENWEQAQSPTMRERAWQWYRGTFRTRVWEGGAVVLIMTRWHEDDLAGRLLREDAGAWTVLRLPALAESQDERDENDRYLGLQPGQPDPLGRAPGAPLSPGRFSSGALEQIRRDVGPQVWAAEYQGVPRPLEGNLFKREWFAFVPHAPARARRTRYWDRAASLEGDFTAGVLLAEHEGLYVVLDVVRGRWPSHEREAVIRRTAELDQLGGFTRIVLEQEPGSAGKDSVAASIRNLAGFAVTAERVTGDKLTRAMPLAAQAGAGNVRLLRGPWNAELLEELAAFPNGRHDDQVDALCGAFRALSSGERIAAARGRVIHDPF